MEYHQTMWAEMSPDVYDGENCDKVRPRWHTHAEGDMGSEYIRALTIDAKHFPPGTMIRILEPCCPECGQLPELCRADNGCEFNWDEWALGNYS